MKYLDYSEMSLKDMNLIVPTNFEILKIINLGNNMNRIFMQSNKNMTFYIMDCGIKCIYISSM